MCKRDQNSGPMQVDCPEAKASLSMYKQVEKTFHKLKVMLTREEMSILRWRSFHKAAQHLCWDLKV